jgi:hypothetical protein
VSGFVLRPSYEDTLFLPSCFWRKGPAKYCTGVEQDKKRRYFRILQDLFTFCDLTNAFVLYPLHRYGLGLYVCTCLYPNHLELGRMDSEGIGLR